MCFFTIMLHCTLHFKQNPSKLQRDLPTVTRTACEHVPGICYREEGPQTPYFSNSIPSTMNFACPLRLCACKGSICIADVTTREPRGKLKKDQRFCHDFLKSLNQASACFFFFFDRIKVSFCCSRRLLLVLFLNAPTANYDIKKENSGQHSQFPPYLPKFQCSE